MKFSILILTIFIISMSCFSQDQAAADSQSSQNFAVKWFEATKNKFVTIYDQGQNDLYVLGYAYHDRNTYTKDKLKNLNEGAYGLGLGRSIVNEKGNTEMLYAMFHLDSHKDLQVNIGYAWVKKISVIGNLKVGIGYTAFLVSRTDFAHRIPIPFALPLATIDIGNASLNAILIPKLNNGINNGNVLFLFGKFTWGRKKEALL
ncbi:MAG: hypothetical protein H7336_08070 [Bacteriovorax sp.]|nr:hypothetical protein [Bacteriovorax sp.]